MKFPDLMAIILLLETGIVLTFHGFLGSYTRLMADDFCSVSTSQSLGILQQVLYWFRNWGGRYSVSIMDSLIFKTLGPGVVSFAPAIVLILWTIVLFMALQWILQGRHAQNPGFIPILLLGTTAIFATLSMSPSATKTLYWWNGMRTYIPALLLASLQIGMLHFALGRPDTKRNLYMGSLLTFLLALTIGGFNESLTVVQVLLFGGLIGGGVLVKKVEPGDRLFYLLLAGMIGYILALLFMLISPGASSRQDLFPPPPGISTLLSISLASYSNYLSVILQSPNKISALVSLLLVAAWMGHQLRGEHSDKRLIPLFIIGGILLSFASIVPSVYATSQTPASRTFIIPTYLLVVSLGTAGFLAGQSLAEVSKSEYLTTVLLLFTVFALSYSSWINAKILYDERGNYINFAKKWDQVDKLIRDAKHDEAASIIIPAMDNWANLDRPNENPKFWATACYSDYYGIQIYGPPYGQ